MSSIEENKKFFISLCTEKIQREGLPDLMDYLSKSDFFTSPASTRFHLSEPGGLLQHSLNVYYELFRLLAAYPEIKMSEESAVIVALFHDLCKANMYTSERRNRKNSNGQWESYDAYTINEKFHFGGHGSKSVFILQNYISILSQKMVDSLKKYGVNERKSLCTVFPKNLPADFHGHFIRGVFDGDGSASYYSRKGRKAHTKAVRFCQGNNQFLIDLMDCLRENAGVRTVSLYKEKEALWSIAYRSNESLLKVIEYMYEDASIYIKRKKELCDLIVEEINKYGNTEITAVGKTKAAS